MRQQEVLLPQEMQQEVLLPQEMQQQEVLRRETLHFFLPFPLLFFLIVLGTLHVYFRFLPHRVSFWVLPAHAALG